MDNNFGSLGDFLPDSEVKCKVHGCNNKVLISSRMALQNAIDGKQAPSRMCDECFALLKTLEDKEIPCSTPDCKETWTWTKFQQLQSMKLGHTTPPRGFCKACHEKMHNMQEQVFPCRLKGCKNSWTLTTAEQMKLNGKAPQPKLCNECYQLLLTLTDKEIPCRIRGCNHTYTWNRFQQLEHLRAGKSLDNPPRMMCNDCRKSVAALEPVEVKCRIRGCNKTWVFNTFEQQEAIIKARNEAAAKGESLPEDFKPQPPDRMCRDCYAFFQQAQDIEQPCRNHFCKNSWLYTRSMQLTQRIKGRTTPPAHYCTECEKQLEQLQDKQMPCQHEGCSGTWTYTREEQLKDNTAGRSPQKRDCQECAQFLSQHPAQQASCKQCGKTFNITGMQQLQAKLGTAQIPALCAECTSKQLNQDIATSSSIDCISRPKIYIPKSGPWLNDEYTAIPPQAVSQLCIDAYLEAPRKLLCLGDDLSCAKEGGSKTWAELLQDALNERLGTTALLNLSLPHSTTQRSLLRLGRDVEPFKPQLVIYSTIFADAMAFPCNCTPEEEAEYLSKRDAAFQETASALLALGAKMLCVIPQPISWAASPEAAIHADAAEKRAAIYETLVQSLLSSARIAGVNLIDLRSNFASSGEQVSRRWMADWCMTNDLGSSNIANWLKNEIITAKLLE